MSMANAMRFLDAVRREDSLRASLYDFTDGDEFRSGIDRLGYVFSDLEIEDALRSLELRAADEAEAAELRELGNWFFLLSFRSPAGSCSSCAGCGGKRT